MAMQIYLTQTDGDAGRDYFLYLFPPGGCPIRHALNDVSTPGSPADEAQARQKAADILADRHGIREDVDSLPFEPSGMA